jgi:TPR repeat protein
MLKECYSHIKEMLKAVEAAIDSFSFRHRRLIRRIANHRFLVHLSARPLWLGSCPSRRGNARQNCEKFICPIPKRVSRFFELKASNLPERRIPSIFVLIFLLAAAVMPVFSPGQTRSVERDHAGSPQVIPSNVAATTRPTNDMTGSTLSDLKRSAESGIAAAQNHLAYLYTCGRGVDRDYKEAVRWYRAAAARGFAAAKYNLGAMFEHGIGVPQDYQKAVAYYRAAAEQGHVLAKARLGLMYQRGWGVRKDLTEAMRSYRAAAEQGNAGAQSNLGDGYFKGLGLPRDPLQAASWYRKAAEQGFAPAENNLGALYHHGWGLEKDYVQALYWYRRAAQQRLAAGENSLGVMYEDGLGVEKDYREAAYWFRAAAEQGESGGQFDLATLYAEGRGVPLDYVSAYVWYSLAASQGDRLSSRKLKELGKLMTPRQLEDARIRVAGEQEQKALTVDCENDCDGRVPDSTLLLE